MASIRSNVGRLGKWFVEHCADLARIGPLALIATLAILSAPVYLIRVYCPDEIWFYRDASAIAFHKIELWNQLPHLGYGAVFWWLYAGIIQVLDDQMLVFRVLRIVCFLLVISIPLLLFFAGTRQKSSFTLHAILLWSCLPVAWWTGKIIAPEIPAYFLCVLAFLLVRKPQWQVAGWLLWGIAAGLKLTVAPTFPLLLLASVKASGKKTLPALGAAVLGLAATNPILLHEPRWYFNAISEAASPVTLNFSTAWRVLLRPQWEWDGIPSGGIFVHGISLAAAAAFTVALIQAAWHKEEDSWLALGALLMWCAAIAANFRARFFVWYVFPEIVLTPFVLLYLQPRKSTVRLAAAAVALQSLFGIPVIVKQYRNKLQNAAELARCDQVRLSVQPVLLRWRPDIVADVFTTGRLQVPALPGVRQYLGELASHNWMFVGPGRMGPPPGARIAMITGDRLANLTAGYDITRNSSDPVWAGQYKLVDQAEFEGGRMYFLIDSSSAQ